MIRVGALVKPSDLPSETANGAYASNAVLLMHMAASYGVELCLFSHRDIDLENNSVNGLFLKDGAFRRHKVPIPPIIDNKVYVRRTDKALREKTNALKKRSYFTRIVTNFAKWGQYVRLVSDSEFSGVAIPTILINKDFALDDLFANLGNDLILKPENSSGGRGIVKVKRLDENYSVIKDDATEEFMTPVGLRSYIAELQATRYLAQTNVHSTTPSGRPFDIRIYAQRKGEDSHAYVMYPRIGAGKILSCPAAISNYIPLDTFLEENFGHVAKDMRQALETFAQTFPPYFQKFLSHPFFDIVFDVGIESVNGSFRLWLFKVRQFPSFGFKNHPGELHLEIAQATLEYYKHIYLTLTGDRGETEQDEPSSFRSINEKRRIWDS